MPRHLAAERLAASDNDAFFTKEDRMKEIGGQSTVCCILARKAKLLAATVVMSAVLTACGGGDDSSAAVQAPTRPGGTATTPTTPGTAPTRPGGSVADSGSSNDSGGVAGEDEVVPPASEEEGEQDVAAVNGSVTLSWIPPTTNDDGSPLKLTGYRIYWGPSDEQFTHSVVVENPGLTRYVVEQLSAGTWYFVATALSGDLESEYSNVFKATIK